MNFPQFWARGECEGQISWRWSFQSLADAQALAVQAARQMAERIRHGDIPSRHHGYYPDRPFREEVLRELRNDRREVIAVVTRNSYGCLVLNTARAMFIDIDLPEPKSSGGLFSRLFGKPQPTPAADPAAGALAKVEAWTRQQSQWSWNIYRTRAGLRLLATHALFDPETVVTNGLFDALGADPLYRQLCKSQKCFRARLTPKPWRCGLRDKPERWPWMNPEAEARFRKWEALYQSRTGNHATCELIRKLGNGDVHPEVQPIVTLHDDATRVESKLALA